MAELLIEKSGFDLCYEELMSLSNRLRDASFEFNESEDTSFMAEKERQCYEELKQMIADLASLAEETAKNVKSTKAGYVIADK